MRFVKPESLKNGAIILDVRGEEEYAHERLAMPHIVIRADKVNPDKFMKNLKRPDTLMLPSWSGELLKRSMRA